MQTKKIEDFILKTEKVEVDDLVPLQGDLKKLDDVNFNKLRDSLLEKGFRFTLHVWQSDNVNYILDGHQRVHVLQKLKKQGYEIPKLTVNFVKAKDFNEAKELILYAISQYGKIDKDGFEDFIVGLDLDFGKFDLPDFDYDFSELEEPKIDPKKDPDDVPEIPEDENPYNVQPGQIWKLGKHRLMCGDSTSEDNVAKLMDGNKADIVFTDPPYGYRYKSKYSKLNKHEEIKNDDRILNFWEPMISSCSKNSAIFICGSWQTIFDWYHKFTEHIKLKNLIVWKKNNWSLGDLKGSFAGQHELIMFGCKGKVELLGKRDSDIWEFDRVPPTLHPTMKPIILIEYAMSKVLGNKVLDLFLGSGSTLIACEKTGRTCYGMEIEIKYVNTIIRRWEEYTGQTAELISS